MQRTTKLSLLLIRITGIVQLVLGILFWTGHAYTYIPVHMLIGSILVLGLWTISVIALVARVRRGLAAFELLWGLALAAFGMQQATLLVGPMHWMIRVTHLLMALSAMILAGALGKAVLATTSTDDRSSRRERAPTPLRGVP
jgi:hypothetical protein